MKILALVLAGGKGSRLYPLTAEHAKPAIPFAGGHRIVDFVLSNLVNSGITSIYVLAQYKPRRAHPRFPGKAPTSGADPGAAESAACRAGTRGRSKLQRAYRSGD